MRPRTLTELERLQLANQYTILEKVDKQNADEWAELQQIVREGYTVDYHKLFDPIWSELAPEDCRYVMNVLEMHHALQVSFQRLEDKGDIKEDELVLLGFAGNDETHLLAYARKLWKEGRWTNVATEAADLDSHFPTADRYPPMLEKLKAIEHQHGVERTYQLTKEEIRDILDEPRRRIQAQRAG